VIIFCEELSINSKLFSDVPSHNSNIAFGVLYFKSKENVGLLIDTDDSKLYGLILENKSFS
jgi:hypothetical protein